LDRKAVDDPAGEMEALRLFTEHIMKGRWDESAAERAEMKARRAGAAARKVSAKVRTGGPVDDEEDYSCRNGRSTADANGDERADSDTRLKEGTALPEYIANYSR